MPHHESNRQETRSVGRGHPMRWTARTALLLLAASYLVTASILAGGRSRDAAARYFPAQLHLHGSLSESTGTMRGHNAVAHELGTVDVLWWTDHEWRLAGHGHIDHLDFDDRVSLHYIPFRDTPWNRARSLASVRWKKDAAPGVRLLRAGIRRTTGRSFLDLRATARPQAKAWQWAGVELKAFGRMMNAPLAADVVVHLDVRVPRPTQGRRQAVVRFELSRQVDGLVELAYVLGDPGEPRIANWDGHRVGIVPVDVPLNEWTSLSLPVTADAERLELGGWDNNLRVVRFGLRLRRGVTGRLQVDDFRIERQRSPQEVLERAETMAANFEREFGLTNHVGLEISYATHMNVYLPQIEMPDLESHPHGLSPQEIVAWAHERNGVVSYNHVFGAVPQQVADYEERVAYLLDNAAFGADLLEVGYPHRVLPLERHLEVWDTLSRDRVFLTGIGTSDSHRQSAGWKGGNNYVTWVWAQGPQRTLLIDGLRERRAFFGDPMRFHGELYLGTTDGHPMGSVVPAKKSSYEVVLRVAELPEDSTVRIVEQGEVVATLKPPAGEFVHSFLVSTAQYRFVRAEVWQGKRGIAFSNCLYFVPEAELAEEDG